MSDTTSTTETTLLAYDPSRHITFSRLRIGNTETLVVYKDDILIYRGENIQEAITFFNELDNKEKAARPRKPLSFLV